MRKVKDAVDLTTGEKIYFKGHAKATYLSDGRNVEDVLAEIPSGESSVFEAVYGETTYEEIVEAYNGKKWIVCLVDGFSFHLVSLSDNTAWFSTISGSTSYRAWCNPQNKWFKTSYILELTTNKVKTISAESTDNQYPSAKAVYDFVNNTLGTIINGDY